MELTEIQKFEEKKRALFYIVQHLLYTLPTNKAILLGLDLTDEEKQNEYVNVYHKSECKLDCIAFDKVGAKTDYLSKKDINKIYFNIIKFTEEHKDDILKYAPTKNRH